MKKTTALLALTLTTFSLIASLNAFAGTLYPVVMGSRWGFVDKNGSLVINPQFERAEPFAENRAAIRLGGQWGYVDAAGKMAVNPQFETAGTFQRAAWQRWNWAGAMATLIRTANMPSTRNSTRPDNFSENRAVIKLKRRFGYIDKTGTIIINPQFEAAGAFLRRPGRHRTRRPLGFH